MPALVERPPWGSGPEFRRIGEHQLNGCLSELFGISHASTSQAKDDVGEFHAGRFYRICGAAADGRSDLRPGIVKRLVENPQSVRVVACALDELPGFHCRRPQRRPASEAYDADAARQLILAVYRYRRSRQVLPIADRRAKRAGREKNRHPAGGASRMPSLRRHPLSPGLNLYPAGCAHYCIGINVEFRFVMAQAPPNAISPAQMICGSTAMSAEMSPTIAPITDCAALNRSFETQ
jgi:hypothetical protein